MRSVKPFSERDPFRVGVVALACVVLLAVGVTVLSQVHLGQRSYTAILAHTAGLRTGESVEVAGVPSGEVTGIELRDRDVEVTFTLDRAVELGPTTTAEVKVATLLGTHYLAVHPRGGGSLPDDQIPLAQTSVPYNLQDVLDQGTTTLQRLDPVKLADALTAVSGTLERSSGAIGPALTSVGRLSALVEKRSDQTSALLVAARQVSQLLSSNTRDIYGLMQQTTLVVSEVTARRQAISQLLVRTRTLSDALTGLVRDTRADLRPALADLDTALAALKQEDGRLQKALELTAPAMRYVANATGTGPWLDLLSRSVIPTDDQQCAVGRC